MTLHRLKLHALVNVSILKTLLALAVLFLIAGIAGFRAGKNVGKTDEELFKSIRLGMSRVDVEKILGKPRIFDPDGVCYGKTPKLHNSQSPCSPTSIVIKYSTNGTVRSKDFYADYQGQGSWFEIRIRRLLRLIRG